MDLCSEKALEERGEVEWKRRNERVSLARWLSHEVEPRKLDSKSGSSPPLYSLKLKGLFSNSSDGTEENFDGITRRVRNQRCPNRKQMRAVDAMANTMLVS
uniref:Uncharacterized protein n=1 Tax=Noccaea caerulescens TaxID=107243 RepID=A0A1J3EBS1_NOCCA